MIIDFILQAVIFAMSVILTPIFILLEKPLSYVLPYIDQAFGFLRTCLSLASVFVHPVALKALISYIPALWLFIGMVHLGRWAISIIRG